MHLEFLFIHKIKFKILNDIIVRMRSGGISGKNIYSYWISTMEILKSFKINNLNSSAISNRCFRIMEKFT